MSPKITANAEVSDEEYSLLIKGAQFNGQELQVFLDEFFSDFIKDEAKVVKENA